MKNNIDYLTNCVAVVFTAAQTEKTFQIISLILTCLSILVSVAFTLYKWYKEANKDGEISHDEIDEAIDIAAKGSKDINDAIEEYRKGGDKEDV